MSKFTRKKKYIMTRSTAEMFENQLVKIFFIICIQFTVIKVEANITTRECCPPNTYLVENQKVCSDNESRINLNCKNGALLLDPSENENDKFTWGTNGRLSFFDGLERSEGEFCVGKLRRNGTEFPDNLVALICFEDVWSQQDVISIILRVLMLFSTLFLLFTLYIYAVLPNLKDLQGKCVIAFICCLVASYITLLVIQTFPNSSQIACIIQAASLYFFMSATFFWNNVITFIIWKAIRNASYKIKEGSRALIYVAWGFGVPLLMVVLAFVLEHLPFGNHIRPHFGEVRCWFKATATAETIISEGVVMLMVEVQEQLMKILFEPGKTESWSYFYGPISVLLILNTIMFLQSIWTLWRSYRTSTISKLRSLRYKCLMYLKLFLLMGITWTFEVISYAASSQKNSKYIWFVTDCLNSAQGVLIFLILVVFRQKVRLGLLKKKFLNINWPKSWAREKIQESSTISLAEEFELAHQKSQMMNESQK